MLFRCDDTIMGQEIKGPMFDLVEHAKLQRGGKSVDEADGDASVCSSNDAPRRLCIEKTFSPRPRLAYIATKLFLLAWIVSTLALSILQEKHSSFYLAYLTNWGLNFSVAYFIMSIFSAVYFAWRPPPGIDTLDNGGVGLIVKTTWVSVYLPRYSNSNLCFVSKSTI